MPLVPLSVSDHNGTCPPTVESAPPSLHPVPCFQVNQRCHPIFEIFGTLLLKNGCRRRKIADFYGGTGHETNHLLCGTILKNINRVIINQSGHRKLCPIWDQERCKVHLPTKCYSEHFGGKLAMADSIMQMGILLPYVGVRHTDVIRHMQH